MQQQPCRMYLLLATLTMGALAPMTQAASITQTYSGPLPITFFGTLPDQGTALEQTFTLGSPGDLNILTSSYASGGFQTNLLLFDAMGSFVAAGIPSGLPDSATGIIGDTQLMAFNLAAGVYTVALTDVLLNQSLTATNLSDGFTANFGSGTTFADVSGNTRTGNYELTISSPAPIPEPSTLLLAAPVLAWLGIYARSARKRSEHI